MQGDCRRDIDITFMPQMVVIRRSGTVKGTVQARRVDCGRNIILFCY